MATMAIQQNEVLNVDVMAKSVCLFLRLNSIGNSRQVSTSEIEIDADKDRIRVSKRLFDCDEYKAIKSLDGEIRTFIYRKALKSPFRAGMYLLPDGMVETVTAQLESFLQQRRKLVDKFISVYPREVERAQADLKSVFDPRDFPHSEIVRSQFYMDWNILAFDVPGRLAGINREIYNREREKAKKQAEETALEIQTALRAAAQDLVSHLVDRLSGTGDNGKPKVFRDSMLENVNEFLATFKARNITDDAELSALVSKAQKLTSGLDPDTLRKNENVRDMVLTGFEQIKGELDGMMKAKPKRSVLLS